MQKQAPSAGRILIAVGFALSCFGLLLFLWVAFGGPIPLKAKSYRISAYFPEVTTLAIESDVRIGGVSVGKVKTIELAESDVKIDGNDVAEVTMEIRPEFAPISSDAKAILRQKTLLGETYVELTSGTLEASEEAAPVSLGTAANVSDAEAEGIVPIEEDGVLEITQTENATQIDEIFNALDKETRLSFQRWQANAAVAIDGRGLDLNDSFGNLGPFLTDASDILEILNGQKESLKGLVRDTGTVFEALTESDQALAGVITNSHATFEALESEQDALAETIQILPTFQRESRETFERLDEFQVDTRPLVQDLLPVAEDLTPTLVSVRKLSPNLEHLFRDLDPLIDSSIRGLPALEETLNGLAPVLDRLDPFLANLNPVLRYLLAYRHTVTDFLSNPPAGLSGTLQSFEGQPAARHSLRQISYLSQESLSVYPQRLSTNRGNGYPLPLQFSSFAAAASGIFPNFDCKNTDYAVGQGADLDEQELTLDEAGGSDVHGGEAAGPNFASCVVSNGFEGLATGADGTAIDVGQFGGTRIPILEAD